MSGQNVFLTGGAGTGKSSVIKAFMEYAQNRKTVMLAPTGKVAETMGGATIHSFFQIPIGLWQQDNIINLPPDKQKAINAAEIIIIDEISMVRADLFTAISETIHVATGDSCRHLPFAGKQIIVLGDFFQLPPVVSSWMEDRHLQDKYGGAFAFMTPAWADARFISLELTTVHRQAEDQFFMGILNAFRKGDIHTVFQWQRGEFGEEPICSVLAFNDTRRVKKLICDDYRIKMIII